MMLVVPGASNMNHPMTSSLTWTTLAKACLLLSYLESVQYVNSETTPSAIPLKDVGGTEEAKLLLTTTSTHSTSWTTQLLESYTVSTVVDLQPTPTHLPESTTMVLASETNARDVTPQLNSQHISKLSPLESTTHVSTYSMSVLRNTKRTSIDSSLSNFIFPTASSLIGEEISSVQSTSTFASTFSSKSPSTRNNNITRTTSSLFISSTNNSSKNPANTSPLISVNTSSSTNKPGATTVLGHQNVTLNLTTTPKGPSTIKLGEEDKLHKDPEDVQLQTPAIIGIGFGAAAFLLILIGVGILVMKKKVYRRNKHDPSNFWDDNVTLSYINSHADFPKDFDAEMMSLDDDSFLNSLDSVTFANIWATDTAKHTNF